MKTLQEALTEAKRDAWVDWQDIPPTAEWLKEIDSAIDAAQAVVFIISPDSVASRICSREVTHAVEQNKRLIPIVCRDVNDKDVPEALARLNWIFLREQDDFATALKSLIHAAWIPTSDWVRAHTRLLVRASEWDQKGRDDSFLLRGSDLKGGRGLVGSERTKSSQPSLRYKRSI